MEPENLLLSAYDFDLPPAAIAQHPVEPRDAARLLVLPRAEGPVCHRRFADLPEYLRPGDTLVLNETRVNRARLRGRRSGGGAVEVLLLAPEPEGTWQALVRPGRRLVPGSRFTLDGGAEAEVLAALPDGLRRLRIEGDAQRLMERSGELPLPPYITEPAEDPEQYQTVYGRTPGSVAAPTAGLHFTRDLLERIEAMGVRIVRVNLQVGLGTFRPVRSERVAEHVMHAEHFDLSVQAAETLNRVRQEGGRIVAVGTTAVRVLESTVGDDGGFQAASGETRLFITPGYRFRAVDALVTNFHLPRSTLLMLVAAFAGRERILSAYQTAVETGYRFYSFGDAMLILGKGSSGAF